MPDAADRTLHRQMAHFAESARAAIAGDRVIIIGEFHDDKIDKPATVMVFADNTGKDEPEQYTLVAHALCKAAQTILVLTPWEVVMRDRRTGEIVPFDIDQPTSHEAPDDG